MGVDVSVKPLAEPLDLVETKAHIRVDHSDEDLLIKSMIQTAREYCENFAQRSFITQTIVQTHDAFPDGSHHVVRPLCDDSFMSRRKNLLVIDLEKGPIQQVLSVEYFDETEGDYVVLDASEYQVALGEPKDRISPAPGKNWPSTHSERLNAVRITSKAGYGDAGAAVPRQGRSAMQLLIAAWYLNREAFLLAQQGQDFPVPIGIDALLWAIRSF